MGNFIRDNLNKDGVDRRGFLQCMAWAGTGMLYALKGGISDVVAAWARRRRGGDRCPR